MSAFLDGLLDLIYPPKCAFCRRLVRGGRMLCPACEAALPRSAEEDEAISVPPLACCLAPLSYTGRVRDSLHRYKFHGAAAYCGIYGELMTDCLKRHDVRADCITWVPLSRKRLRKRGYDQARLLALEISRRTGIPCRRLIRKIRNNPAQSGTRSAAERAQNVLGVYRAESVPAGARILLVDDIVTTGSTMRAAAEVLLEAGAGTVTGLAAAHRGNHRERTETDKGDSYASSDL